MQLGYEKMYYAKDDVDNKNPIQTKQRLILTQVEMTLADAGALSSLVMLPTMAMISLFISAFSF